MAVGNPFGKLFGRSPIRPIQEQMKVAHRAASLLEPFLAASQAGDWETAKTLRKDIVRAEREADKLKSSVRRHLPKSLFLPVSRTDLLELVSAQDRIANRARDIAELMVGRKMQFPEKLQPSLSEYVATCVATSQQAFNAVQELDELLEVGFSGREVTLVETMIKELGALERSTDKLGVRVNQQLFKLEASLPPVDVMFMYKVIETVDSLAASADKVGHRLQIMVAR